MRHMENIKTGSKRGKFIIFLHEKIILYASELPDYSKVSQGCEELYSAYYFKSEMKQMIKSLHVLLGIFRF